MKPGDSHDIEQENGAVIALVTAVLAAVGLLTGYFHIQAGVGLAIVGIVIGTGVARGAFSAGS